jgi:DNA processing protein
MDDTLAWLTLTNAPGIGSRTARRLIDKFGTPQAVLTAPHATLAESKLSKRSLEYLASAQSQLFDHTFEWLEQPNHHIVTWGDAHYPPLLREISDPPMLLYLHGDPALLSTPQLAIVGSRNPSSGGSDASREFASYLANHGFTITSGLATGIDGAAHSGALEHGRTIAITGTGLDRVYPARHRQLAHKIAEKGALVSEFPLNTKPHPGNFPRRNRIISGLSLGTLVVEAAIKSGSLVTARLAMEQGREVFAMPGSIHNPLARGCHKLIREGAKLVETAVDIVEELAPLLGLLPELEQPATDTLNLTNVCQLDEEYQCLLKALGYDPQPIDTLIQISGLTTEAVSSMLLRLELDGVVASAPGGRYYRTGSSPTNQPPLEDEI